MTGIDELIERVKGWLWPTRKQYAELVWRTQCAGHPLSDAPCAAYYHIAKSPVGTFEIFETEGCFLLDFPRPLRAPAELFADEREAKNRALFILKALGASNGQ